MSHKKGAYLGGIRTVEDIRIRCRIDECGCWIWGLARRRGTPIATILDGDRHRSILARTAAMIVAGKAPRSGNLVAFAKVDCQNPIDCVNPDHIRFGTRKQMGEALSKRGLFRDPDRLAKLKAEGRKRQKLTSAQWLEIERSNEESSVLAMRYGVSIKRIQTIRQERRMSQMVSSNSIFNLAA